MKHLKTRWSDSSSGLKCLKIFIFPHKPSGDIWEGASEAEGAERQKTVEQKVSSAKTPLKQRRHQGWSWQHICISSNQTRSAPQSHIFTPNKATFALSYFSLPPNFYCRLQQLVSSDLVLFVTVSTATHMSPIRSHKSWSRKGCGTTCTRPDLFEAICNMS